jgi:hypothetical protein
MFKSFSVLAVFTLLGVSAVALPALAPKVEASEATVVLKSERLQAKASLLDCATQVWPQIAASCLRATDQDSKIVEARLVTARR